MFDIHEPGQTPEPHAAEKRVAIGIDLGTTHSVVAVVTREGTRILSDADGETLVPSAVRYHQGVPVVGETAFRNATTEGGDTVTSVKRLMGRAAADIKKIAGANLYDLLPGEGLVRLRFSDKPRTPVEISSDILRYLKALAETALETEIIDAVITVPAYFDEAARLATKDAARLAGLNVLRLLNEPTAAALAYGLDQRKDGIYAVYDLGGGTFDISILHLEKGIFQVLAVGGDTQLGGDDFDRLLAEHILQKESSVLREKELAPLLSSIRTAREKLSNSKDIALQYVAGGQLKNTQITREQLEKIIQEIVQRTLDICEDALRDAGIAKDEINAVVMVGGTTRTPVVVKFVERFFGMVPFTGVNPDHVVAEGAAIQAAALAYGGDHLLLDVTPLSLGIETMGGLVEKIIHRNTPIPTSATQEFTTYKDSQDGMVVHVLQGEREMVHQNRSLARFELKGIPSLPAGIARVEITYRVDADGLLSVEAKERTTGAQQHIEVKPSYGLELAEIERMLRESMEHARTDITERLLTESRVEAERVCIETESAMRQDESILRPGERQVIDAQLRRVRKALQKDDRDEIDYEVGELAKVTRDFAERRMNQAIAEAVGGQHIDQWTE